VIPRLALVLAAVAAAIVPLPPAWVELLYSRRAYLALQRLLTPLSNRVPFALFDLLLAAMIASVVVTLFRLPRRWRKDGALAASGMLLLRAAAAAAVLYLAFVAVWGLNYRRVPLASRLAFSRARVTGAATADLAKRVARRASEVRAEAGAGPDWAAASTLLSPAFARVQRQLATVVPALPGRPKPTLLTVWFERAGVDGMTAPFFLETLVSSSVLPVERPFVVAHEWAHLAGYADESEANFVGWLVCLQGPPAAEYSGELALLWHLLAALPPREREAAARSLGPGVRADLAAMAKRAAAASPILRDASWRVYDKYLKVNRVQQGVRSYGAALDLVLGTRFGPGWVPEKKP
jgi:hypothetical protein